MSAHRQYRSVRGIFSSIVVGFGAWLVAGTAAAGITGVVGSKHDLTSGGTAQATTGVTNEVCVFCHTPHGGASGNVPLWNKVLPTTTTYARYDNGVSSTVDGLNAPVGSVSIACLSCHDGGQAMDVVLNRPGSGLYSAAGAEIDPAAIGAMTNTGTFIPNLTTDLSNDHPISIQYGGGGCSTTNTSCTTPALKDPDFKLPQTANINGLQVWWLDVTGVGTGGTREKTDMILYTRTEATVAGGAQPFVECGSCHDPHNSGTAGASSVAFLRVSNDASRICTACHNK